MSITLIITIITCLVSYQCFNNRALFTKLQHSPYAEVRNNEYYRMISSGFVHGSWMHLGINMFVFYQFGGIIERYFVSESLFGEMWGRINFVALYFLAIIVGDIPTFIKHKNNHLFASVGASGAVSAIMFVYILFDPWEKIYLYGIIGIPGILAAFAYVGYSTYASKNSNDNIDHLAHLWGAIFGFVFAIMLKPALLPRFMDMFTQGLPF